MSSRISAYPCRGCGLTWEVAEPRQSAEESNFAAGVCAGEISELRGTELTPQEHKP